MPRNSNGTYSLVAGNPVVTGTIITSSWANTTLPDLGTELTDSLSRTAKGGMLAVLKHVNGSSTAPSVTFSNDAQSGLYLNAAGDVRLAVTQTDIVNFATSGVSAQVPISSTAGDVNLKTNTALSDAAATLTAAQLIGGEFTITPTVARIQTTDTAANIIAALSGSVDNSHFEFNVVNLAAFDVTVAAGVGVTLVGNMVVNDGSATFRVRRLTSSTVSVTRLDTGVATPSDASKANLSGAAFTGPISSTAGDVNLKTNTALSDAAATLTAAQLIGGEFTITPTVARIQTTDTAANIIAALSGSVDNSNFETTIVNLAAFDVTVAAGAGVTLVGNMVVNDGSATFRVRRLTSSTVSITRLETGATPPTPVFSVSYLSGAQTLSAGAQYTLAHGLGVEPKLITFTLECISPDVGHSIGQRTEISMLNNSRATDNRVHSILKDATNITIRLTNASNAFFGSDPTSGAASLLTNSRWELYVGAYA